MCNRPFSSYVVPLFQNEYSCNNFHMKKSLIYTKINMQGRTHFHVVSNIFQHERSYSTTFPYTEKRVRVITSRFSRKEPVCSREWRKSRLRGELNRDNYDFWTCWWVSIRERNKMDLTLQHEIVEPATSLLGSDMRDLPKCTPNTIWRFRTVSAMPSYTPIYSARAAADVAMTSDSLRSRGWIFSTR